MGQITRDFGGLMVWNFGRLALGAAVAAAAGLAVYFGFAWYAAQSVAPIPAAVVDTADAPETSSTEPAIEVTQETTTEEEPATIANEETATAEEAAVEEPQVAETSQTETPAPNAPLFDVFRIDADGAALVAGRGEPMQNIAVLLNGEVVAEAMTDSGGAFVALTDLPPSADPRVMQLRAESEGTLVFSEQSFIVEPFGMAEVAEVNDPSADDIVVAGAVTDTEVPAAVEPLAAAETEGDATVALVETAPAQEEVVKADLPSTAEEVVANGEASVVEEAATAEVNATQEVATVTVDEGEAVTTPEVAETPAETGSTELASNVAVAEDTEVEPAPESATPQASPDVAVEVAEDPAPDPQVLVADAEGVRVVAPSGQAPEVLASVALDTITYDPSGEVLIAGRAQGEGVVQVYIDNKPVTTSRIASDGNWRTDLPQVDTGVYTLRIDEVAEDGAVVSRIETPFKREEPEAVAAVMAEETGQEGFQVAVKTVQPGSTLWAIAREQFGQGILYVAVFEANRDLIRDPDLIYPGQVFRMPEIEQ